MTGATMVINWWGVPMALFWALVAAMAVALPVGLFIGFCYAVVLGIQYVLGW